MVTALEQYGTGSGIPIGVGLGGTAAVLAGVQSEFAVVAAFGAIGGLVAGGFAGRFTARTMAQDNWQYRLLRYSFLVCLCIGGLLGLLTAWMRSAPLEWGFAAGAGTGVVFSLLLSGILITKANREPR